MAVARVPIGGELSPYLIVGAITHQFSLNIPIDSFQYLFILDQIQQSYDLFPHVYNLHSFVNGLGHVLSRRGTVQAPRSVAGGLEANGLKWDRVLLVGSIYRLLAGIY